MTYTLYKLKFTAPVHFGSGRLGKTMYTFYADTLFSAMCTESQKMSAEGAHRLYEWVCAEKLCISDGLPYSGDTLFLPKPMTAVTSSDSGDSKLKKAFKKLTYIPADDIPAYLGGNYDPTAANELLGHMGRSYERARAAVGRGNDSEPYNIGVFSFEEGCGLYFICAADDDIQGEIDTVIEGLSYAGIGGKTSSGLGRFSYTFEKVPDDILKRLSGVYDRYMSISVSMADDDELEGVLDGAGYELIMRSGFVASHTYSEDPLKKRDFYSFKAGACFNERFKGNVFNVGGEGTHPVYRYAVPMLMGL